MINILSSEQIKRVENEANENGLSFLRLMENAGTACAKVIRNKFDKTALRRVLVVCGKGKNGGDGFVIARKLHENGYKVKVLLALGIPKADTASEMFSRLDEIDIPILEYLTDNKQAKQEILESEILVDCIFGTGFSSEPDEMLSELFGLINSSDAYTVSIDLPSGFYTDSSELCSSTVQPDMTVSVIALKHSLVYPPSSLKAGEVKCVGIGISEKIMNRLYGEYTLDDSDIKKKFPERNEDSNKGDYGNALIIAGSYEMPGAALLASKACTGSGAGLVRLAFPDKAYPAVTADCPEKVLAALPSNEKGEISEKAVSRISELLEGCTAVLVGCGLGKSRDVLTVVEFVLENSTVPVVLDADALNVLKGRTELIKNSKAQVIITPHPGEAARLLGTSVSEVQADRLKAAKMLYEATGAIVLLKGYRTVVTADAEDYYINTTGNSALSKAGSGDVLSGLILSLLCQGFGPCTAAVSAAFLHGRAGECAAKRLSKMGVSACDIADEIKTLLKNYEK